MTSRSDETLASLRRFVFAGTPFSFAEGAEFVASANPKTGRFFGAPAATISDLSEKPATAQAFSLSFSLPDDVSGAAFFFVLRSTSLCSASVRTFLGRPRPRFFCASSGF